MGRGSFVARVAAAGMKKDLRQLARLARRLGWSVTFQRSGHLRWQSPEGARVTSSATPCDRRALLGLRRDLREAGLNLPAPKGDRANQEKESL
jgi:hypothetical protein